MKIKSLVFFAVCGVAVFSCRYDKYQAPQTTLPTNSVVSYSNDIHPLLVMYCFGKTNQACHVTMSNQGANGDFTTYGGLKAKVDNGSIQSRVLSANGGMPPSYSTGPTTMAAADKEKLASWVSHGALNN